jgi:deoxyxylulose-5-phosphate synthase
MDHDRWSATKGSFILITCATAKSVLKFTPATPGSDTGLLEEIATFPDGPSDVTLAENGDIFVSTMAKV